MSDKENIKTSDQLIELYHIGEFLVSSVIDSIGFENFIKFLRSDSFVARNVAPTNKNIIDEIFAGSTFVKIEAFSKLDKEGYSFDSESDVDVGIFFSKGEELFCFPIEVKMGETRMAKNWTSFTREMNNNPTMIQPKNPKKIKGCMPSLLSGTGEKLPELLPKNSHIPSNRYDFKVVNKEGQKANFKHWGLCILGKNAEQFQSILKESKKDIFDREEKILAKPVIFSLNDLVKHAKGKDETVKQKLLASLSASANAAVNKVFKKDPQDFDLNH